MPGSPLDPSTSPAPWRARADELRRLARTIESADLAGVAMRAGPDTWSGRGPARCAIELATAARELDDVGLHLRSRAAELDHAADRMMIGQVAFHPLLSCPARRGR